MTTIVLVRKNNEVVVAGDGQVSMGNTVVKSTASKVRKIEKRDVVAGFAGSTADALTLFERLEGKLEKHAGNLSRAAVELAKDWRTDKYLRRLEALMAVGDKKNSYIINNLSYFLELYFLKKIYSIKSKNKVHNFYNYFLSKISNCNKYNLDLESVLIEFDGKVLNE